MTDEKEATVTGAVRPAYVYAERGPGCAPAKPVAATTLTTNCPYSCPLLAEANEPPEMAMSLVGNYFCIYTPTGRVLNAHNETADRDVVLQSQANGAYSTPPVLHLADVPHNITTLTLTNLGLEVLGPELVSDRFPNSPWSSNLVLRYMNLANNSIASVDGVEFPLNLHMLTLAKNKLTSIDRIAAPRLAMLSVSRNPTLPPSAFTPGVAMALPQLRRLVAEEMEWTEIPSSLPSSLTELSLAKNRLSQLSPRAWPPALRYLNAQNAGITTVYANFTAAMRTLCLGGNAITAFYATSAQFELLSALPQRTASADVLDASRCSQSSPLLTTTTTNTSCTGHVTTRLLWGMYPVCILDTALDSLVTSPASSRGVGIALIVVSALLGVIALVLLVLWLRFLRRPRPAPKWYEGMDLEMDTKDMLGMDVTLDPALLYNDVRSDPAFAAYRLPEAAIERQSILARGGFGIVYLATLRPTPSLPDVVTPTPVALKRLLPSHLDDVRCMDDFMDEIRFSARLRHDNIVRFYGFSYSTLADLAIVTEYMERGDLWQWLRVQNLNDTPLGWQLRTDAVVPLRPYSPFVLPSRTPPPAMSKFSFLCDIVEGLMYLHTRQPPLMHRDLKAKNVLLSSDYVAKLTDFGVARETCDYTMTAEIGTVAWIAPEVLKGVYYTEKADVYSLGVLLSEMDTLEIPYADFDTIHTTNGNWNVSAIKARIAMLVVSGEIRPSFSADVPRCIADVADRCLAYEPTDRPTIRDVWAYCQQIQAVPTLVAAAHAVLETLPPVDLSAEPSSLLMAECLYMRASQVLSTWTTPQTTLTANCPATVLNLPEGVGESMPDAGSGDLWCVLLPDGVTYLHALNATRGATEISLTGLASPARFLLRHESPPIPYLESVPSAFLDVRIHNVGLERLAPRLDRNNASLVAARRLDLTNNSVASVANITFPLGLHTLVLDNNRLQTLERFSAPSLRSLSVSGNPFAAPPPIASLFPNLTHVSLERLNLTVFPIMAVPSTVTKLSLAHNQLRDMPVTLPASVQSLDLQHNQITRVQLALTPNSRLLCLGGNPITALYATPAQFALLEKLLHQHSVGPTSGECSTSTPFVSVATTSDACTGRFRVKRAWGVIPICVVDSYAAIYVPPTPPISQATWLAVLSSFGFLLLVVGGSFVCFYKKRGADADQGKLRMLLDLGDGGLLPPIETVLNDVRRDPIYAPFWIPPDELTPTRVLARGGFGVVFAATLHAHEDVAMKRLLSTRLDDAACVADFMDEIRLCARLFHPNIVRFVGFTSTTLANLSIVTEYMARGDLWHFLLENDVPWTGTEKPLKRRHPSALSSSRSTLASDDGSLRDEATADATKFSFLCDVVFGLQYLHTLDPPVLHRDVKARNVLLSSDYVAKLTDFGVAREASDYTMTADVGTIAWIAPEVLKGCFYDAKADVYSLGVLMAEMDTREPPYAHLDGDLSALRTRIALLVAANELQPTFSHSMPLALLDLAHRCLTHDPRDRPSIQDVDASLRMLLL